MWDNACTMHRRDPFDQNEARLMKRTTILPPAELAVPF
jgi:taurine dioxygenase